MHKGKKLGSGTYGRVYEATEGDKKLAFKRNLSPDEGIYVASELDILSRLKGNPRIISLETVSFYQPPFVSGAFSPLKPEEKRKDIGDDVIHFFFEMAECDLDQWIRRHRINFMQMKQFMVDILLGVESIHISDIMHRDLKVNNLVVVKPELDPLVEPSEINEELDPLEGITKPMSNKAFNSLYRVKVIDFGLAKPIALDNLGTPGVTTCWYRSPEVIGGMKNFGIKVDAWAVGCIFYELIFKKSFVGNIEDTRLMMINALLNKPHYAYSDYEIQKILRYNGTTTMGPIQSIKNRIEKSQAFRSLIASQIVTSQAPRVSHSDRFSFRRNRIVAPTENVKSAPINRVTNVPTSDLSKAEIDSIVNGIIDQLGSIIEGLLVIDPEKRLSITEVLDSPFFNTHRDYINKFRKEYPPVLPQQRCYGLIDCIEREWATDYVIEMYESRDKYEWYTHRRIFHSIDLFDRLLRYKNENAPPNGIESEHKGRIMTKLDTEIYYFVCLYIAVKYFSSLHAPIKLEDFMPRYLLDEISSKELEDIEVDLIMNVLDYKIYRHTIYEAINFAVPDASDEERDHWYGKALYRLTECPPTVGEIYPGDRAAEIIGLNITGIQEYTK